MFSPVVWKEEEWYCGDAFFHSKISLACIWSNFFNDLEILDKVKCQLLVTPFWSTRFSSMYVFSSCIGWGRFSLHCSIHKGFCFRQGISSPISDLTERLLLEERDPPAIPQESLYEAPPFDEVWFQVELFTPLSLSLFPFFFSVLHFCIIIFIFISKLRLIYKLLHMLWS